MSEHAPTREREEDGVREDRHERTPSERAGARPGGTKAMDRATMTSRDVCLMRTRLRQVNVEYSALVRDGSGEGRFVRMEELRRERKRAASEFEKVAADLSARDKAISDTQRRSFHWRHTEESLTGLLMIRAPGTVSRAFSGRSALLTIG